MKPYVMEIDTNAKVQRKVALGQLTVLLGDNGEGKSGLLSAVKLALEGEDEHLGKTGIELMKLVPGRTGELYSVAQIGTDGGARGSAEFRVKGSVARAQKPTHIPRNIAMPPGAVLNGLVAAVLAKSVKAQREAILKAAAPADCLKLARQEVPDAFRAKWDAAVAEARLELIKEVGPAELPEADLVVAIAEGLREKVRVTRKATKAEDKDRPEGPNDAELEALRVKVSKVRSARDAAVKRDGARERLVQTRAQLAAVPEGERTGGALPDRAKVVQKRERLNALKVLMVWWNEQGQHDGAPPICPFCNGECDQPASTIMYEQSLVRDEAMLKTGSRPSDKLAGEIERLEQAEREAVAALPEKARETPAQAFNDRLSELEQELLDLEQRAAAVVAWGRARADKVTAEGDLVVYEALSRAAAKVVEESLHVGLELFCKRASAPLGGTDKVEIKLHEGRRPVCEVGLRRGELFVPWDTLSGAQRALVVCGFASAWAASVQAPVKVVTVDDVWMGRAAMMGVLKALRAAVLDQPEGPTQAIVCAVELSPDVIAAAEGLGWSIVEV